MRASNKIPTIEVLDDETKVDENPFVDCLRIRINIVSWMMMMVPMKLIMWKKVDINDGHTFLKHTLFGIDK